MKRGNEKINNGFGITCFILSLLAFSTYIIPKISPSLFPFLVNIILGFFFSILSLIFYYLQVKRGKTRLANAGLIIDIIVITFCTLVIIAMIIIFPHIQFN